MSKVDVLNQITEWDEFENFFSDSFCEGQMCRELRLSHAEVEYIQHQYPFVRVSPISAKDEPKSWYLVSLGVKD